MKPKLYLRVAILGLLFVFLGCQEDILILEETATETVEEVQQDNATPKYIEGSTIPDIVATLASRTNSKIVK